MITGVGMVLADRGTSRIEREGRRVILRGLHGTRAAVGASFGFLARPHVMLSLATSVMVILMEIVILSLLLR